jgi:SAM-dependent methyltransferase
MGIDVDPVVKENPALDEAQVIAPGGRIPHEDSSIGVVVSDFTFEHVDDPIETAAELHRVVKPGGWVCARTPNKWGYIGVGARLVPNAWHVRWLTRLQPNRKDIDVFPVRYRLNTRKDLRRAFPPELWEHVVYTMPGEPNYAGDSRIGWSLFGALMRIQPRRTEPMLLIFLRKK